MTQPQAPERNITASKGWARLLSVMAVWVPARLYHTANVSRGIRNLRGKAGA